MINLITEEEVKQCSTIYDNLSDKYFYEALRAAQRIDLCEIIGSRLLDKLETIVDTGEIETEPYKAYKSLLEGYIKDYLLYSVQYNLVIPISYKFTNAGLMVTEDEKLYQPDKDKIELIKTEYQNKANYFKKRLQDYLKCNNTLYPELTKYNDWDIPPNLKSSSNCPIWLGLYRSKCLKSF